MFSTLLSNIVRKFAQEVIAPKVVEMDESEIMDPVSQLFSYSSVRLLHKRLHAHIYALANVLVTGYHQGTL